MQIKKNPGEEPVRGEVGLVLLLVVLSAFGLLTWTGLFLGVQWSVSTLWTAAVAVAPQAAASPAHILPAPGVAPAARP